MDQGLPQSGRQRDDSRLNFAVRRTTQCPNPLLASSLGKDDAGYEAYLRDQGKARACILQEAHGRQACNRARKRPQVGGNALSPVAPHARQREAPSRYRARSGSGRNQPTRRGERPARQDKQAIRKGEDSPEGPHRWWNRRGSSRQRDGCRFRIRECLFRMSLAAQKLGVLMILHTNMEKNWRPRRRMTVLFTPWRYCGCCFRLLHGHVSRRWWATLVGTKNFMDNDFPAMIHYVERITRSNLLQCLSGEIQ